jgi:hypothetical protein
MQLLLIDYIPRSCPVAKPLIKPKQRGQAVAMRLPTVGFTTTSTNGLSAATGG